MRPPPHSGNVPTPSVTTNASMYRRNLAPALGTASRFDRSMVSILESAVRRLESWSTLRNERASDGGPTIIDQVDREPAYVAIPRLAGGCAISASPYRLDLAVRPAAIFRPVVVADHHLEVRSGRLTLDLDIGVERFVSEVC